MKIIKVNNNKTKREFTKVAKTIYKDNKIWVCPLDKEIDAIFNPRKNPYYNHGVAERWILKDENEKLIGRIAAFIDFNTANTYEQLTGRMGFFECINDKKAAFLLFDTAKAWLKERNMEAMDGPVNFGETDSYWGLLVDGFTHPSYEITYNHAYYQGLFESFGFKTYYKQEGYHLDITKPLPERFSRIAEWFAQKPGFTFSHFTWKEQDKYIHDFVTVYNNAWASFKPDFKPIKYEYIKKTVKKAKAIIDEEFIWYAYKDNEPIAIYLMYPDVNMILKQFGGKLHLWNKFKFLYLKKKNTITRARALSMGVVPKYQGKGVEAPILLNFVRSIRKKPQYKEIEFSWVGDFNPKMKKIITSLGSVPAKHYITYRYLFDKMKPFKRYPVPKN